MYPARSTFNVLSLDGGGAKGVFTIGVLEELEKKLGGPLSDHFDLIYGTSTGAIIASFIALGESIETIDKHYFNLIPKVMPKWTAARRSKALLAQAKDVFKDKKFTDFKNRVGIVATNSEDKIPLIFKSFSNQAISRQSSFVPGMGATIATAVVASCSAYPFFKAIEVETEHRGKLKLLDGGFVANNPILFSIAESIKVLNIPPDDLRVLSIGTGQYPESHGLKARLLKRLKVVQTLEMTFSANTNNQEKLCELFFPDINLIRINNAYTDTNLATNLLESNPQRLEKMKQLGCRAYGGVEPQIKAFFG